jgi:signal transduction histidine kinase
VRATVRGGDRLIIEIADHGPGVPPDVRDKIFEPFFTNKTQGTGLGLALSQRIVEQHGGTLGVTNAPAGGAVFRIEIPRGT